MQEIYRIKTQPLAQAENIVQGEKYRITMLTEGLLRLEYAEDGIFEDRATQMAFYRDFPKTNYRVIQNKDGIEIHTSRLHLIYDEKKFSSNGLSIQVKGNISIYQSIWHYGEEFCDLGGTARTLDMADGAVQLDHGLISRVGFSVLDDAKSQILLEDGWIEPRKKGIEDLYFFGYGHDYKEALDAFYYLCGKTPMLPRYALGNWWSRYYKYTEESYLRLMDEFEKRNLPFSVAVIDMDWHLVDINPKYGSGWTGYTWNKKFFPNPVRFLEKLHQKGMRVTLNVHPAEGVRGHEEMYQAIAEEMEVDYIHEDSVCCDPANPKFIEAYFKYLHHPREEEGVDFWWIDWQQGSTTKIEGLDPLWIFNHFHFLDNRRDGKRPMTFSRYAGPGSHRYPVGFSGDTVTTWESLDFQPYFTATASNIGYGWWSHDIGGHMLGYKNDEMVARWTQYGIYSPIMRLHSACSEFNGKEPWRYKQETEAVMSEALRERHRMLPYLYTMNYKNYQENRPLVLPMYYEYPEEFHAYEVRNQFFFGNQMIVAPITSPRIPKLNVAKVKVWLPKGSWYDIHTGMLYDGNRMLDMYRSLDSIPVLMKAGGIVPFTDEISATEAGQNPSSLRIKVCAGADGEFELYEDDNETCDYEQGHCVITRMTYEEKKKTVFRIHPAEGEVTLIPEKRSYVVEFAGCTCNACASVEVKVDEKYVLCATSYDEKKKMAVVEIPATSVKCLIQISLITGWSGVQNDVLARCFTFLNQAEIGFLQKDQIYQMIEQEKRMPVLLSTLQTIEMDDAMRGVLQELITAK